MTHRKFNAYVSNEIERLTNGKFTARDLCEPFPEYTLTQFRKGKSVQTVAEDWIEYAIGIGSISEN